MLGWHSIIPTIAAPAPEHEAGDDVPALVPHRQKLAHFEANTGSWCGSGGLTETTSRRGQLPA